MMKLRMIVFFAVAALLAIACSEKKAVDNEIEVKSEGYVAVGDSTIYGLACDGCTDSVIVFLPDSGGNPIMLDVVEAYRNRQVFGRPEVGDKLAVYMHPTQENVAQVVINIDELKGSWVYKLMPIRKAFDEEAHPLTAEERLQLDSLIDSLMVPQEYGFSFKRDNSMQTIRAKHRQTALDKDVPVEYPKVKRYTEWHIHNGKLILTSGVLRIQNDSTINDRKVTQDTATFLLLKHDTLALQFADHVQGYSRKQDSLSVK